MFISPSTVREKKRFFKAFSTDHPSGRASPIPILASWSQICQIDVKICSCLMPGKNTTQYSPNEDSVVMTFEMHQKEQKLLGKKDKNNSYIVIHTPLMSRCFFESSLIGSMCDISPYLFPLKIINIPYMDIYIYGYIYNMYIYMDIYGSSKQA